MNGTDGWIRLPTGCFWVSSIAAAMALAVHACKPEGSGAGHFESGTAAESGGGSVGGIHLYLSLSNPAAPSTNPWSDVQTAISRSSHSSFQWMRSRDPARTDVREFGATAGARKQGL